MTTIKHNFSDLASQDNPIFGMMLEVNNTTNAFLVYCFVILFFTIASFVIIKRTNDINKGMLYSLHITTILILLLYYGGLVAGLTFVPSILILGLLTFEGIAIAGMYYARSNT